MRNFASVVTALVFMMILNINDSHAQDIPVSGVMKIKYEEGESVRFPDAEDRVMYLQKWDGINISKGDFVFMDSAGVEMASFNDYYSGQGTVEGYVRLFNSQGEVFLKFNSEITIKRVDEKRIPHLKGTAQITGGGGSFNGITGEITFEAFLSSQIYLELEWEGEYAYMELHQE